MSLYYYVITVAHTAHICARVTCRVALQQSYAFFGFLSRPRSSYTTRSHVLTQRRAVLPRPVDTRRNKNRHGRIHAARGSVCDIALVRDVKNQLPFSRSAPFPRLFVTGDPLAASARTVCTRARNFYTGFSRVVDVLLYRFAIPIIRRNCGSRSPRIFRA